MEEKTVLLEKGEIVVSAEMVNRISEHLNKMPETSSRNGGTSYNTAISSGSAFFFWWLFLSVMCWFVIYLGRIL